MHKCCIGHGIFTHSYLLKNEERLEFIPRNSNYSQKHVFYVDKKVKTKGKIYLE